MKLYGSYFSPKNELIDCWSWIQNSYLIQWCMEVNLKQFYIKAKQSKVKIVRIALTVFLWSNEALNKHPLLLLWKKGRKYRHTIRTVFTLYWRHSLIWRRLNWYIKYSNTPLNWTFVVRHAQCFGKTFFSVVYCLSCRADLIIYHNNSYNT